MLQIRMLGDLEVLRDGESVALPPSRKTRALLAYLVLKGTPQRRDALCEMFWEIPDDPRGALRWSLSRLRPVLNDPDAERLVADRERVGFVARGATIDYLDILAAVQGGLEKLDDAELTALLAQFRGPLIAGIELSGQPAFETWRLGAQEAARQLHIKLLDALIARLQHAPDKQVELLRHRVEIDPGCEDAHVSLVEAMARSGLQAEAAKQSGISARILSGIGPFSRERLAGAARIGPGPSHERPLVPSAITVSQPEPQSIRFCTTADGVRIAYASTGSGPPLVKTANWLNHLEHDWESPVWRGLFQALVKSWRLIRYDERGNGLSDWDVEELSLDAFVRDFEAVVDAAGLEKFPIFAVSQGCTVAIEYAARHPERVTRMALFGGFARGWKHSSRPDFIAHVEAIKTLTAGTWGRDNPALRQMFTSMFMPNGTSDQFDSFNTLQKVSTSPANAVRLMDAVGEFDVRHRLSQISVPTLVAHCRGDAFISASLGREMAAGIPTATFLGLESDNHLPVEGDPALAHFLTALSAFLGEQD